MTDRLGKIPYSDWDMIDVRQTSQNHPVRAASYSLSFLACDFVRLTKHKLVKPPDPCAVPVRKWKSKPVIQTRSQASQLCGSFRLGRLVP